MYSNPEFNLPQRVDQITCYLEGIKSRRVWEKTYTSAEFNQQIPAVQAAASDLRAGLCHFDPRADSPPDFRQAEAQAVFALRKASDHPSYKRLMNLVRRVNYDEVVPWRIFRDSLRAARWEITGFEEGFLSSPNPFQARLKLWEIGIREVNFFNFGAGTQLVFHLPIRSDKFGERFGCFSEGAAKLLNWHYPRESCALKIKRMTFLDRVILPNPPTFDK